MHNRHRDRTRGDTTTDFDVAMVDFTFRF